MSKTSPAAPQKYGGYSQFIKFNGLWNSFEVEEAFTIPKDGARPGVDPPKDGAYVYKYMPLDKVYLQRAGTQNREGPYLVEKTENGKYSLCDEAFKPIKNGETFHEAELVLYSQF
ncbi:hypothetical protein ABW19_dt0200522 [Dactylella cylindrospora]|nr:hypothetical protein ABW19_dt0200522 [Dactylella cylindrospora]